MPDCPSCRRPVAVAGHRCLYCGGPLPPGLVAAAGTPDRPGTEASSPGPPTEAPERILLILDLDAAEAPALVVALDLSPYEADLLARRGGFSLHRILPPAAAEAERRRLTEAGLAVETLPEAEARVEPHYAVGGEKGPERLALRTEKETLTLRRGDLLLVVAGPIARQFQPTYRGRRMEMASLDEGFRFHLHRRADPRPVEIDSANFDFGSAVPAGTRLEIETWLDKIAGDVPRDDAFRRLPPALGVAAPEPKGPLAAASALGHTSRSRNPTRPQKSVILDNAVQFRFYSAWRGALERRRSTRSPSPGRG